MDKYTERNKERCDKENTESSHPKISGGPAYSLLQLVKKGLLSDK